MKQPKSTQGAIPAVVAAWITSDSVPAWNFSSRHAAYLEREIPGWQIAICKNEAEFLATLPSTNIALTWAFHQKWFNIAPALRFIATPAAGREGVDVIPPAGVDVRNSTFHGELIAETVAAMLLGHYRGVFTALQCPTDDLWPRSRLAKVMRTLRGRNVCILGYGHIGEWIARLLAPFGVHITGIRRHLENVARTNRTPEVNLLGSEKLDEVLPSSEILILCLPGTPATDMILNAARINRLPAGAVVVNVGRGNAIDECALIRSLHSGHLGAAYLDVAQQEPVPADSPMRSCPRLVIFPHASAISDNYLDLFCAELKARFHAF